jgi:hypothetical protein
MELETIKRLLIEVNHISKHFVKVAKLSGENFNVFKILNLQSNEVRTHSSFLSELLNPQGCHGQEDLFLKLFVNHFDIKNFDSKSAFVEVEKHTGQINEDFTTGGRIDILLTDKAGNHIIIENKILAGDQKNQLIRYYNFDNNAILFYLTLFGTPPSDYSTNGRLDNDKYRNISYCVDIIEWLTKCQKESFNLPIIRETISQYIHLLQNFTNQSTMEKMNDEIKKLIVNNPDYIEAIEACSKVLNSIILDTKKLFIKIFNELFPKIIVPLKGDESIHIYWNEDVDGVFIGYQYYKSDKNCSNMDLAKKYHSMIKEIKSDVHYSSWHFVWYNPTPFVRGQKFESLDKSEIFKMYLDNSLIIKFVESIVLQANEIKDEFLNRIIDEPPTQTYTP